MQRFRQRRTIQTIPHPRCGDAAEALGTLIGALIVIAIVIVAIVYVVVPVISVVLATGALWGAGHSIKNYGSALYANIDLERPWIP